MSTAKTSHAIAVHMNKYTSCEPCGSEPLQLSHHRKISPMFTRLKKHADGIEAEIHALEKTLELKTKCVFSIVTSEVSQSSVAFMSKLLEDLQLIEKSMSKLLVDSKHINSDSVHQFKQYKDLLEAMSCQMKKMEDHLVEFGYVKERRPVREGEGDEKSRSDISEEQEVVDDSDSYTN